MYNAHYPQCKLGKFVHDENDLVNTCRLSVTAAAVMTSQIPDILVFLYFYSICVRQNVSQAVENYSSC